MDKIYGNQADGHDSSDGSDDDSDLDAFFKVRKTASAESGLTGEGRPVGGSDYRSGEDTDSELSDSEDERLLQQRTAALLGGGSDGEGSDSEGSDNDDDDDDEMGSFGSINSDEEQVPSRSRGDDDEDDEDGSGDDSDSSEAERRRLREQKASQKAKFDALYDKRKDGDSDESGEGSEGEGENGEDDDPDHRVPLIAGAQKHLRKTQFALQAVKRKDPRLAFAGESEAVTAKLVGLGPGTYVRVLLRQVHCEFVRFFNPKLPVLLGGVASHEHGESILRVRIKKHRWYPKILKSNDPLIFSLGWRRFQSIPQYTIQDDNERHRFLKYAVIVIACVVTRVHVGVLCVFSLETGTRRSTCIATARCTVL